jgi:hypothetical protein
MKSHSCAIEYVAYGVHLRFVAESAELLGQMTACAPWSAELCATAFTDLPTVAEFALVYSGDRYRLTRDGAAIVEGSELDVALEMLTREVMVHVADSADERVFVHAGVVEWQGRVLVLPGRSFAGKSTLVAELVRAGATYYSDEYAVIDERGNVHPYARDLQIRERGGVKQRSLTMKELKGSVGTSAVPVSHVVFAEYVEGAMWKPEMMSPGSAVLAMMEHAIAVQRAPARVMATLVKMMETATALRSERGDAGETAQYLLKMISAEGEV